MKRRQFTGDFYLPTDYMTLEGFYKALQRDTGVDDTFFMFDYPVPESEEDYQKAVKEVRWLIDNILSKEAKKPKKDMSELHKLQADAKRIIKEDGDQNG